MRKCPGRAALAALLILGTLAAAGAEGLPGCPSREAALAWLELVDGGRYAQSWQTAAPYFQGAITADDWQAAIKAVRPPLGEVTGRRLVSCETRTRMAGAPDGRYQILLFQTAFAHKKSSRETLAMLRVPNGAWRMVGYHIN